MRATTYDNDPTVDQTVDADDEQPKFELSLQAMLAGAGAAVTAAVLGSTLGVAGTLIGAALGSAISMIASAIYSHSLASARYRVQRVIRRDQPAADEPATEVLPGQAWSALPARVPGAASVSRAAHTWANQLPTPPRTRRPWVVAAGGAFAAFLLALVSLTGYELISGRAVSGDNGGLTVLGGAPVASVQVPEQDPGATTVPSDTPTDPTTSTPTGTTVTSTTVVTSTTTATTSTPSSSQPSPSAPTSTGSSATAAGTAGPGGQ